MMPNTFSTKNGDLRVGLRRLLTVSGLLLATLPLAAQDVALQIILPSAARMPRTLDQWESDPGVVQIIMTNVTGEDLTSLRFSFTVRGASRGNIVRSADGNPNQPRFDLGPNETSAFLWGDVISTDALTYGEGVEEEFVRDGIPEDNYLICGTVLNTSDDRISIGRETCAAFTVLEADPPQLIFPVSSQEVDFSALRFQWTPVLRTGVVYRLMVRPWYGGQDPVTAMEANPVWLEEEILTTGYQVLPSDPPVDLFADAIGFVWQVQSLLDDRPYGRNEGLSRIESFRILGGLEGEPDQGDEGPLLFPIEWRIPNVDPVIVFSIENARKDSVSGRYQVDGRENRIEVAGSTTRGTFDQVVLSADLTRMIEGSVTLDRGFGVMATIDPTSGRLGAFSAVARNQRLNGQDGIMIDLGGGPEINPRGLFPAPDAAAEVRVGDFGPSGLTATFSDNFAFGFQPFTILQGRITFEEGGSPVAYVDRTGFRRIGALPPLADTGLPERLPLPDERVAYLTLTRGGQELVTKTVASDGTVLITTTGGQTVRLTLTAVPGSPELDVELSDFVVDGQDWTVLGGNLIAPIPSGDVRFSPDALALPFQPTAVIFRAATGLGLEGNLSVFGRPIPGSEPLVVSIANDGYAFGLVRQTGLSGRIPMVEGSERALLAIESASGTFSVDQLGQVSRSRQDLDLRGRFVLSDGTGREVGAAVDFAYTEVGGLPRFDLLRFLPSPAAAPVSTALRSGTLEISRILNLSMAYQSQFSFEAELLGDLVLPIGTSPLRLPLDKMQLRETGLFVRAHQQNELPDAVAVPYASISVVPIAFRTRPAQIDWFSPSAAQVVDLDPRIDLEVGLPGFRGTANDIANATPTVNGSTYQGGRLIGEIIPYAFEGGSARAMLGAGLEFLVASISGRLGAADGPGQTEIRFTGELRPGGPFVEADATCEATPITLNLAGENGFAGSAPMTPCAEFLVAMARLRFGSSTVSIARADAGYRAVLNGAVTAYVGEASSPEATSSGTLGIDLITGRIVEGSLTIPGPFTWAYPQAAPAFPFRAPSAVLSPSGVAVNGPGGLALPPTEEAATRFGNVVLTLDEATGFYEISSGQITIDDPFALLVGLSPLRWATGEPATPVTAAATARLDFAGGLTINSQGIMEVPRNRSGSAAALRYGERVEQALTTQFSSFKLGTRGGVRVADGELALESGGTRVGWFDANGFNVADAAPVLADKIGLPNVEAAYLRVRDDSGALLVTQDGRQISTVQGRPVSLIFPTLGDSTARPAIPVTFTDLEVNASSVITGGQFSVEPDLDLSSFGFPVHMQRITYARSGEAYVLTLSARLSLPGGLSPTVNVPLAGLAVEAGGFKLPNPVGEYSDTYDAGHRIAGEGTFDDDRFRFVVNGVKIEDGATVHMSGKVNSAVFRQGTAQADLFFTASFVERNWQFNFDVGHFEGGAIPANRASFLPIALAADSCVTIHALFDPIDPSSGFTVAMSGVLDMPQVLGRSSQGVTLERLQIGTTGIRGGAGDATNVVELFGDILSVTAPRIQPTFTDAALRVGISSGSFSFFGQQGRPLPPMVIATDGTLSVDSDNWLGSTSLVALTAPGPDNAPLPVLRIDSLRIESGSGGPTLHAAAALTLPAPMQRAEARRLAVRANRDGEIETRGISETFRFASAYELGDNPAAEFALGPNPEEPDAVFEIRSLVLDTDLKPEGTSLRGTGVVYLEGDANKRIFFGDQTGNPAQLVSSAGFRIRPQGAVWNVAGGVDGGPIVDAFRGWDALRATLTGATMEEPEAERFGVLVGAELALGANMSGGAMVDEAFRLTMSGLDLLPEMGKGGLQVGLSGLVDMQFGSLAVFDGAKSNQTANILLNRPAAEGAVGPLAVPESAQAAEAHRTGQSITVRRYLRLGPAGGTFEPGSLQSDATVGEQGDVPRAIGGIKDVPAFGLAARELILYETTDGSTGWALRGAELGLGTDPLNPVRAVVDLEAVPSPTGGRAIQLAGRATAGEARGALVGRISAASETVNVAAFIGLASPVGVVPGLLSLSNVGTGIFWKPDAADLTRITELADLGEGYQPESPLSGTDLGDHVLVVYGRSALLGTADDFAAVTVGLMRSAGSYLLFDGNIEGGGLQEMEGIELEGRLRLAIDARGADRHVASGSARLATRMTGLVEAPAGEFDFFAAPSNGTVETWGIHGPLPAGTSLLEGIPVGGKMILGGDRQTPFKGFLFELSTPTPFDSAAVRFAGDARIDAWYSAQEESFGALLKVPIEAQVLGGVTVVEGVVEAIYLREDNRNILFGSLVQDAEVVGFRGQASAWVAYDTEGPGAECEGETGCWALGMGEADNALAYRAKLDAVQTLVESIETQAPRMASLLEPAVNAQRVMSADERVGAGVPLLTARFEEQALVAAAMENGVERAPESAVASLMVGELVPGHPDANLLLCTIDCVPSPGEDLREGAIRRYVYGRIPDTTDVHSAGAGLLDRVVSIEQDATALETALGLVTLTAAPYFEEPDIRSTAARSMFADPNIPWEQRIRSAAIDIVPAAVSEAQTVARMARTAMDTTEAEMQLVRVGFRNALADLNDNVLRLQALTERVGDFLGAFAEANEAIDRYYATGVSQRWIMRRWVNDTRALLTNWRPDLDLTMQAYEADWRDASGGWSWENESSRQSLGSNWEETRRAWDDLVTLVAGRNVLAGVLEDSKYDAPSPQERGLGMSFESAEWRNRVAQERNALQQALGINAPSSYQSGEGMVQLERSMPLLLERVRESGTRLWYETPLAGLEKLERLLPDPGSLVTTYRTGRRALGARHAELTKGLDSLYIHQTRLLELLYSMAGDVRRFENRYGRRSDLPALQRYESLAEEMLARPGLRAIVVTQNLDGAGKTDDRRTYQNHFSASWSGQIAAGRLVENSVAVTYPEPKGLSLRFGSVGSKTTSGFHAFRVADEDASRQALVRVRARTAGGRTAVRNSDPFEVDVDFHTGWLIPAGGVSAPAPSASVGVASAGENVVRLRERTPRPSAITLKLPELEEPGSPTRKWSTDGTRVALQVDVSTVDEPGDIVFHAAVAPFTDTGFLNVTAASRLATPLALEAGTGDEEGTIRALGEMSGLSLVGGRNAVCVFVAYPGQTVEVYAPGQVPLFACATLQVDTTPPVFSNLRILQASSSGPVDSRLGEVIAPLTYASAPPALRPYESIEATTGAPTSTVLWEARDPESGINMTSAAFCLSTSDDPEIVWSESEEPSGVSKHCASNSGPGFNGEGLFLLGGPVEATFEPVYLHVRGVNGAGLETKQVSELLPAATDASAPLPPVVQAGSGPFGDLVLWFLRNAWDPQTGIKGYQYAVGTQPGMDDLRTWPAGEEVDYAPEALQGTGDDLASYVVPALDPTWEEAPQQLYFSVRALNGQAGVSHIAATGPVALLDDTPPEDAQLAATLDAATGELGITADVWDPQSGVVQATYRLLDGVAAWGSDPEIRTWTNFLELAEPQKTQRSHAITVSPAENEPAFDMRYLIVELELRNAAGLVRTYKVDLAPAVSDVGEAAR